MTEEQVKEEVKPVTVDDVVTADSKPAVEEGVVSPKDIEVVEKEIEAKDTQKIEALKGDLSGSFKTQMEDLRGAMESQYKEQLNSELETYKKQIEETYTKKFEDVNQKLEELTPRKGLVQNTAENPYTEIAAEAKPEAAVQPVDAIKQIRELDAVADREAGEAFFNSLHK